jgi:hypothetical protein
MSHTYLAFIDESGDDGLKAPFRGPGSQGGSSRWLVLSACVIRAVNSHDAVNWRDEIRSKMPEKQARDLHFARLNHGQKVAAVRILATKPVRTISVIASKEHLQSRAFGAKNQLYFFMARYLIERLSWLCRDFRRLAPEGDGRVAITFSRRGGMQYDAFRSYLTGLHGNRDSDVRIHWPVIDIDAVDARDHSTSACLQLSDIVASSFSAGFEPDRYGNCEPRYSQMLKPITYSRGHNYLSYGVKIVPNPEICMLSEDQAFSLSIWKKGRQPPGP